MVAKSLVLAGSVGAAAFATLLTLPWLASRTPDDVRLQPITGDALILADGVVVTGRLEWCAPESCIIDGAGHPRNTIDWIALGVSGTLPTDAADASGNAPEDMLYLHDGAVEPGPLYAIDGESVYAARGERPRREVAWIRLAQADAPNDPVYSGGETPADSGASRERRQTGSGSSANSGQTRPRGAGDAVKPCPGDQPLGAHLRIRQEFEERHAGFYDCRAEASFWFELHSTMPGEWPTELGLVWKSDLIHYRIRNFGCSDVDQPGVTVQHVCTQPPGPEVAGSHQEDSIRFLPTLPELDFRSVPDEITAATVAPGECTWRGGSASGWSDLNWQPMFSSMLSAQYLQDSARVVGVESSGCLAPDGNTLPECLLRPDRFAVIPFSGDIVKREDVPANDNEVMSYRWALCCGCGEEASASPFPDEPPGDTPCGPPRNQAALLDLALDQQDAYLRELHRAVANVERLTRQAAQWENDFTHATRDCRLWSVARTLVGVLASGGTPGSTGAGTRLQPAGEVPHIKELWNLLAMAEKVQGGDGSWLLPNVEFGGWVSLEDAWDAFSTVYGGLASASPQSLRQGLQQCGAPTLEGVLDGAYEYLRIAEELAPATEDMHRQINRLRDKDEQIHDLWLQYQQACRDQAECNGTDPAVCDTPPERVRPSVSQPGEA